MIINFFFCKILLKLGHKLTIFINLSHFKFYQFVKDCLNRNFSHSYEVINITLVLTQTDNFYLGSCNVNIGQIVVICKIKNKRKFY